MNDRDEQLRKAVLAADLPTSPKVPPRTPLDFEVDDSLLRMQAATSLELRMYYARKLTDAKKRRGDYVLRSHDAADEDSLPR